MDFVKKTIMLDDCKINLRIWDTVGSERFQSINRTYYRGSLGALICFDLSEKIKRERIEKWVQEIKDHAPEDCCIAIIGTKSDKLLYPIETGTCLELKRYSEENNYLYFETSAMKADTIEGAVGGLLDEIKVIHLDNLIQNPSCPKLSFTQAQEGSLKETRMTSDGNDSKRNEGESISPNKNKLKLLSIIEGDSDKSSCNCG